jgi:hypothetical protein
MMRLIHPCRNKAVSDGAIAFFLDHYVHTRVARISYGAYVNVPYNKLDPEHVKRSASIFTHADGLPWLGGVFDVVLPKVHLHIRYLYLYVLLI